MWRYWCLACCLAGPLLSSCVAEAAEITRNSAPETQTSLVVFDYPLDPHSLKRSTYPMVYLSEVVPSRDVSGHQLEIGRKFGLQVLEVPAGKYYVRQVLTEFGGFVAPPKKQVDSNTALLDIPPGVVAYLGNVQWSSDKGLRLGFSKAGLLDLQKKRELHAQPLMLVAFGAEPKPVSWD